MKLYGYWRSSASWRVRIALGLKGLAVEMVPVNLLEGEHRSPEHLRRSPLGQIPVLELADGTQLTQSLAICAYLDAVHPDPPIIPDEPLQRARAWALAEVVNAGIQPLQNMKLLATVAELGADRAAWGQRVIRDGLVALDRLAQASSTPFLAGDRPSIADICLVPQLYNARRFQVDLSDLPRLTAVEERCGHLLAFQQAHPDMQSDARST